MITGIIPERQGKKEVCYLSARLSATSFYILLLPIRHVGCQQCLEQPAMVGNAQVQQFMDDDEVPEIFFCPARSSARVITPEVEHEPHLRVIR